MRQRQRGPIFGQKSSHENFPAWLRIDSGKLNLVQKNLMFPSGSKQSAYVFGKRDLHDVSIREEVHSCSERISGRPFVDCEATETRPPEAGNVRDIASTFFMQRLPSRGGIFRTADMTAASNLWRPLAIRIKVVLVF